MDKEADELIVKTPVEDTHFEMTMPLTEYGVRYFAEILEPNWQGVVRYFQTQLLVLLPIEAKPILWAYADALRYVSQKYPEDAVKIIAELDGKVR